METLIEVASGDKNVVIGISGFGSAMIGRERWEEMAALTGRTGVFLRYDAQEFPWETAMAAPGAAAAEMLKRWAVARDGARIAADFLVPWLERWIRAGREVLIVGFSLGAYIAWEAVKQVSPELRSKIEVVFISGSLADRPDMWEGADDFGRIVNVFSSQDMTLKWLYPHAVSVDDTPAAGLGPLSSSSNKVMNVDVTDLIGHDHLWASRNLNQLVRLSMGCMWGAPMVSYRCSSIDAIISAKRLSPEVVDRLYRWTFIDPDLWSLLELSLQGNEGAIAVLGRIDSWSLESGRLSALLDAGATVSSLMGVVVTTGIARRNAMTLRGMVRHWMSESPDLGVSMVKG